MKKLFMLLMSMFLMAWAIPSGFAQEITITLVPGWNWISYPKAETMSIAMALGDFTPVHGDMIKSQSANISYINGQWRGSMEQFTPGRGYMYFSNRAETVSFIFAGTASLAVTTSNPTEVTSNSAICGGTAASNDGTAILMKGVCWATHPQPTTNDSYSENGNDSGPFTEEIVGLIPNTVYYVRAYAVSVKGVSYGEVVSFTTLDIGGGGDHDYVDLGLPSGTLWATCNVGAIFPEDYGDYFAWGETQPKEDFSYLWSTYQHCYGSYNTLTKYCTNASYGYNGFTDSQTTLLPEDDVATANWGTDWRMPTDEEWGELFYNTPYTWTTQYGIYGILFTASNGNSLFLPAAGYQGGSFLVPGGSDGYYWSSSLYSENPSRAMFFDFNYGTGDDNRAFGLSVRPVRSVQPSTTDYSITVISSPIVGGMVTGGGIYQQGQPCTVNAVAATGYAFTNWTENDSVVSANANYTFTVNSNRTLVANFSSQAPNTYTISVSSNPTNGGSVTGGGTYQQGQSCTVSATANSGYTFLRWTENGNQVSTNDSYTFTVTGNRTLVAQFQTSTTVPTVTTAQITNIQQTTAIGGGNVTNSGGSTVSERGICWSISHNPTTSGNHASSGTGTGSFTVSMTDLTANTIYYVRAYATNSVGTAYGNEVSFTTQGEEPDPDDWVDLGLPSGLLWATRNVGATGPEDYGDYFAWGETSSKSVYDWDTYIYGYETDFYPYCRFTKYNTNDNLTTLLPGDDAATANYGGRMPTKEEWIELIDNCTSVWTTLNGVNGRLLTGPNGTTLFLPAAGSRWGSELYGAGVSGHYWSSSLGAFGPDDARFFFFNSYDAYMSSGRRVDGQSVRAVLSTRQN